MKKTILIFFLSIAVYGQTPTQEFSYNEFIGFVKKYHPLVKKAQLEISAAQANLMMARGGFDPKIAADFEQKKFKGTEYYTLLNSSFKIPTWYGIELKGSFDNSIGDYINPENYLPTQGLASVGISIPIGQGLFINQRMADIQKAKHQINLSKAEVKLQAIAVLFDASVAYFNWKKTYNERKLYEQYTDNAQKRFQGIKTLIEQGDKPAIDSVEAKIIIKNRLLSLEDSKLKWNKARLELSNFLWLENNVPLELKEEMTPQENLEQSLTETLRIKELMNAQNTLDNHPKINSLKSKLDILTVDKKLKANALLPKIDIGYSYLSQPNYFTQYRFEDYKLGVNFYFPLFLRKERGSLKMASYKVQDAQFTLSLEKLQLKNKIEAQQLEITSVAKQKQLVTELVADNRSMLTSEERLFSFGESSIFLLNTRENNLISTQLSQIAMENRYYTSCAELFKIMANPD